MAQFYLDAFVLPVENGPAVAGRRFWKWSLPGIVLVALLPAFFNPTDQTATHGDFEVVERVVDGDTLLLTSGERVRLIGVDTPETKQPKKPVKRFGKEASEFTRHMVEGKRVRLELDPANAATGHKDNTPQRRTVAYFFWMITYC
jgi:endonuclease YncB( thermonuclease family)